MIVTKHMDTLPLQHPSPLTEEKMRFYIKQIPKCSPIMHAPASLHAGGSITS